MVTTGCWAMGAFWILEMFYFWGLGLHGVYKYKHFFLFKGLIYVFIYLRG